MVKQDPFDPEVLRAKKIGEERWAAHQASRKTSATPLKYDSKLKPEGNSAFKKEVIPSTDLEAEGRKV